MTLHFWGWVTLLTKASSFKKFLVPSVFSSLSMSPEVRSLCTTTRKPSFVNNVCRAPVSQKNETNCSDCFNLHHTVWNKYWLWASSILTCDRLLMHAGSGPQIRSRDCSNSRKRTLIRLSPWSVLQLFSKEYLIVEDDTQTTGVMSQDVVLCLKGKNTHTEINHKQQWPDKWKYESVDERRVGLCKYLPHHKRERRTLCLVVHQSKRSVQLVLLRNKDMEKLTFRLCVCG